MCSYQTLEYLKELSLVLGLDKPVAVTLAEGAGETIDEDEMKATRKKSVKRIESRPPFA